MILVVASGYLLTVYLLLTLAQRPLKGTPAPSRDTKFS